MVNIEDCTKGPRHWHVMDKIKCGQRNDKKLEEKLNELLRVINPEYSIQLYLYTHSYDNKEDSSY